MSDVPPRTLSGRKQKTIYHRVPDVIDHWSRRAFAATCLVWLAAGVGLGLLWAPAYLLLVPWALFLVRGAVDMTQRHHTILRNFPVLGHLRYLLESMRPELRQYFVESDREANPFDREDRTVVYQRAKDVVDTLPFGTRDDLYCIGREWIQHSLFPRHVPEERRRVTVGGEGCMQPYSAALLNVSAMSFGSLSWAAIEALNRGAKLGDFAHNTGEGGISPYHRQGGDLVWQIGTGYFGCRTPAGGFDPEAFAEKAAWPEVKMIELKLSQGAKPAHGGILPGRKVTPEIAKIRGVPVGRDVISPPAHSAFDGPYGLVAFVARLRELSGGKPVGFKLCLGNPVEFLTLCHAMRDLDIVPDFITVDGAEGGTGAAPIEFSNSVGTPLDEGLTFVHNALLGAGLRDRLRLVSAGKIATGFHIVRQLALGADLCNAARTMLFALGCIQALKCNTNRCPTGVATQDRALAKGLDVESKAWRVRNFQSKTVESALELIGAAGLDDPARLRPYHVVRRVSRTEVRHLGEIFPLVESGAFLEGKAPPELQAWWSVARRKADKAARPSAN
ncbi:MAG: FMN-binding glutamate synthase family protein [Planctomycetota bacterium]|nr:MAG: FMN-binding glutamate synthase family protein [Planctomycetota bacterium]